MNEVSNSNEQEVPKSDTLITNQNINNLPQPNLDSVRPKRYFGIIGIILILIGVVLLGTMNPFGYPPYAAAHFFGSLFCIITGIIFAFTRHKNLKSVNKKSRLATIGIVIGILILLAILFAIISIQIIMRNNLTNMNKNCYKTENSMFICD